MKARVVYGSGGKVTYYIEGEKVSREEFDKVIHAKTLDEPPACGGNTSSCWPMKSDALAVHPDQIPDAMERNKKHGVMGVSYDPVDGRAILSDRGARRDLMKLEGVHDNNGGYGDDHNISGTQGERKKRKKLADL